MNTSHLSETLTSIPDKAAVLANEAGEFAQDNLVRPARDFMRRSRRKLSDVAHEMTDRLSVTADDAAAMYHDRRDKTADWISHNPFAAIAAAAGAGVLLTLLMRKRY